MSARLRSLIAASVLWGALASALPARANDPATGSPVPEFTATPEGAEAPPVTEAQKNPEEEVPPPVEVAEPQAQTPAPEPDAGASAQTQAHLNVEEEKKGFQRLRPNWGVQLYGAITALGSGSAPLVPGKPDSTASAFAVDLDFQPAIVQAAGVIGVGLSAGIFPATGADDAVSSAFSIYQVGAHLKYQARYFREQILVPYVGFNIERLSYAVTSPTTGQTARETVVHQYPVFGAMFLLNHLEPNQAHEAYRDWGILRSYLLFEIRKIDLPGRPLALSGTSYFFGLRVEY